MNMAFWFKKPKKGIKNKVIINSFFKNIETQCNHSDLDIFNFEMTRIFVNFKIIKEYFYIITYLNYWNYLDFLIYLIYKDFRNFQIFLNVWNCIFLYFQHFCRIELFLIFVFGNLQFFSSFELVLVFER